jgi:hypothetical protein
MRHNFDKSVSTAVMHKVRRMNSVTGGVTITPDQLGVNITKSVFGWKYGSPGGKAPNGGAVGGNTAANAWIDQYGLPFQFVIGGQEILLPPVVTAGGTPVPPLPDGLTVQWAPSFMGVAIPSDMLFPVSRSLSLSLNAVEMASAQHLYPSLSGSAAGSWTSALLINNGVDNGVNKGETLLLLLMSVMECLIYSYSSYPWGNSYNDLSSACMTGRNYQNWLIYPYQKNTFLGNVLSSAAPIYKSVIAPAIDAAVTVATGGSGTAAAVAGTTALSKVMANQTTGGGQPQTVSSSLTTQVVPTGVQAVDANGNPIGSAVVDTTTISPIILLAAAALILYFIFK